MRGEGSFREVVEAANLCRLEQVPLSIKSVVTKINKGELLEIALLGSALGAIQHSFISLLPTPLLVSRDIIPTPHETRRLYSFISGTIIPSMKMKVQLEGFWSIGQTLFSCNAYRQTYNVDYLGNLTFCCNLSHVRDDKRPATHGRETLAQLCSESLREGIGRHYRMLAKFTEDRLGDVVSPPELFSNPCYWCLDYFGKLEWLRDYPDSPWVRDIFVTADPRLPHTSDSALRSNDHR